MNFDKVFLGGLQEALAEVKAQRNAALERLNKMPRQRGGLMGVLGGKKYVVGTQSPRHALRIGGKRGALKIAALEIRKYGKMAPEADIADDSP